MAYFLAHMVIKFTLLTPPILPSIPEYDTLEPS